MEDLIEEVTRQVPDTDVLIVRLEVGRLSCASPHALRFGFEVCAMGTRLERATLEIDENAGEELRLKEIEVA